MKKTKNGFLPHVWFLKQICPFPAPTFFIFVFSIQLMENKNF